MSGETTNYRIITDPSEIQQLMDGKKINTSVGGPSVGIPKIHFVLEHNGSYSSFRAPIEVIANIQTQDMTRAEALFVYALQSLPFNHAIYDKLNGLTV